MLENKELILRAVELSDVDKLFIWENDRRNWRISHTLNPISRHALSQFVDTVSDIYTDRQLRLMIINKTTKEAIGAVDLYECDFKNHRAGIGILIAEQEQRGKGYATEVLELMIAYAFNELRFHQLYCAINADNTSSIALFQKFGFTGMGIRKDWNYFNGHFSDELTFQLINGQTKTT